MRWIWRRCWRSVELIEPLTGTDFRIWKQTRTGLLSYPLDPAAARAHLASQHLPADGVQSAHRAYGRATEADHAATAEDVIEACAHGPAGD